MQSGLLPLFPLQVVLLPGGQLPLHIFEDRYKEMIGEALKEGSEFGVILANEKGIVNTGCTATIEQVLNRYPDGRMDILTRGRRRFEVLLLNEERTFLRGAVEYFDDEDTNSGTPEWKRSAIEGYNQLAQEPLGVEGATDPQLSFRLAQAVSDLPFRQSLLAMRSEAERMKQVAEFLPTYVVRQQQIQHAKNVAPKNGHGRKH